MGAAPVLIAELACLIAAEERHQQGVGALILSVIGDPHGAQVHRQVAPATLEVIAAHHRGDAVRFQEASDEVRLGRVFRDVDPLHAALAYSVAGVSARMLASARAVNRKR